MAKMTSDTTAMMSSIWSKRLPISFSMWRPSPGEAQLAARPGRAIPGPPSMKAQAFQTLLN
jgi:hypothetical protein